jgi:monoamine oxidase
MDADVIVVGAGVAGLGAALHLARAGRRVLVLEARTRAGGRILTVQPRGLKTPVELGPEFVHGGNPLLRAALRASAMRLEPVRRDMWTRDGDCLRRQHAYWRGLSRITQGISPGTRQSFARFLRNQRKLPRDERARLRAFAESFNAAPAGRLSAETIRIEHGGVDERQSRPRPGYGTMVDSMVARLRQAGGELRLASRVTAVHWRKRNVVVRVGSRALRAPAVIIALPLGILRAGTVRFRPALRRKQRVIRRLGWGQVARVTLRFDAGFWTSGVVPASLVRRGRPAFGFFTMARTDFPTWWAPSPAAPLIVGWSGGPRSVPLLRLTPARCVDRALQSLAAAWNCPVPKLRRHLRDAWMHNWVKDRFVRGAYSYAVAGFESGPKQLARPIAGTLFFAGEATAGDLGTVHGALASGVRAAKEVLVGAGKSGRGSRYS